MSFTGRGIARMITGQGRGKTRNCMDAYVQGVYGAVAVGGVELPTGKAHHCTWDIFNGKELQHNDEQWDLISVKNWE